MFMMTVILKILSMFQYACSSNDCLAETKQYIGGHGFSTIAILFANKKSSMYLL